MPSFIVSLALGRAEPHAVIVCEEQFRWATDFGPARTYDRIDYVLVTHAERFPADQEYEAIADRLDALLSGPRLKNNSRCLMDVTHASAAVRRLFWRKRPGGYGIWQYTLSSAAGPGEGETGIRDLLGNAQVLFQSGRVRLAATLPELESVKRGLVNRRSSAEVDELDPLTAALVLALHVGRGAGKPKYLKETETTEGS